MSGSERIERLRDRAPEIALIAFVLVAGAIAGFVGVRDARLGGLATAALVLLLIASRRPVVIAVIAVGAVYAVQRLGSTNATPGSGGGISYSDAIVAAAAILSLPALSGTAELRRLRFAGTAIAAYLALLVPGIIGSPTVRVYLEWAHRLVIVGGAMLVGAWLAREHAERTALRLFTAVSVTIAAFACYDSAANGFDPASPLQLNKNLIGGLFAVALILLLAAAPVLDLPPVVRFTAVVIVGLGLLSAQSRGGDLAAVFGVLVAFVMHPSAHSLRAKLFAGTVAAALAVVAFLSVKSQIQQDQQDFRNSSAGVRFNVEHVTLDIWRTSPIIGVGLKYFNTGNYGPYAQAPNNVIDNELAESGLIGLAGFALLQFGVVMSGVRRRTSPLVPAAVGAVAGQLLHGMVDIYWAAGVVTLPFLLLGIALAGPRAPAASGFGRTTVAAGAHRAM